MAPAVPLDPMVAKYEEQWRAVREAQGDFNAYVPLLSTAEKLVSCDSQWRMHARMHAYACAPRTHAACRNTL